MSPALFAMTASLLLAWPGMHAEIETPEQAEDPTVEWVANAMKSCMPPLDSVQAPTQEAPVMLGETGPVQFVMGNIEPSEETQDDYYIFRVPGQVPGRLTLAIPALTFDQINDLGPERVNQARQDIAQLAGCFYWSSSPEGMNR